MLGDVEEVVVINPTAVCLRYSQVRLPQLCTRTANRDWKPFEVVPLRWIVERTFSWFGWFRRLTLDYERYPKTAETMVVTFPFRLSRAKRRSNDFSNRLSGVVSRQPCSKRLSSRTTFSSIGKSHYSGVIAIRHLSSSVRAYCYSSEDIPTPNRS